MRQAILILLIGLYCLILDAQTSKRIQLGENIVPNPGFEQLRGPMPEYDLDGSVAFRNSIAKWMSPTKTTPDLLFVVNDYYSDMPHNGIGMAGILTHNPDSKRSDTWREYLQIRLQEPLKAGEEYAIEFWAKKHRLSKLASNNLGAYLSISPFLNQDYYPLLDLSLVLNETKVINSPDGDWTRISGTFRAYGSEQFLIIGNFFNNEQTTFVEIPIEEKEASNYAYYLIDDVSLQQFIPEPDLSDITPEVGQVIRLDRIYFAFDKWDLLPQSFPQLDQLAELLIKYPGMTIAIHGHTDSRGSDTYNQRLSDKRSAAVLQYLLDNEIDPDRLESKGFGESKPIETNTTDEGRQFNRRVEFVVLDMKDVDIQIENVSDKE